MTLPSAPGRAVVSLRASGPPDRPLIRPMLIASDEVGATVCLMADGALLLAGDAITIDIYVGAGARLELVEPAGTVAYAMDGGSASWDVTIELASGAILVWPGEAFVVAEGADVSRRTTIRLGESAIVAWRELLVLGRHGERSGSIRQTLEVTDNSAAPLLHEDLQIGPSASPWLMGGARAMGSVHLLGRRLSPDLETGQATRLELEGHGSVVRRLAAAAHQASSPEIWAAARYAAMHAKQ